MGLKKRGIRPILPDTRLRAVPKASEIDKSGAEVFYNHSGGGATAASWKA